MKKFFHFKVAAPSIAALAVVALTTFTVFAQPSSTPTGGNVDARFDTIGVGVLGSENLLIDSSGYISNPGTNAGGTVGFNDPDGVTSTTTSSTAIKGISTDGVGVAANSTNGNAISGNSTNGIGVSGSSTNSNGVQGTASGSGYGVMGSGSTGSIGYLGAPHYGVYGLGGDVGVWGGSNAVSGVGVSGVGSTNAIAGVQGTINVSNGFGIIGHASAINSTAIKGQVDVGETGSSAGYFANIPSSNSVSLGTDTNSIVANGNTLVNGLAQFHRTTASQCDSRINGSNMSLTNCPASDNAFHFLSMIDAFGGIGSQNSGGTDTAPLAVKDDSGLSVGNAAGTVGLDIAADGTILNPSTYTNFRGTFDNPTKIDDNLDVTGSTSTDFLSASGGDFGSYLRAHGDFVVSHIYPADFDTDTRFENGGIIVSNSATGGGPDNISLSKDGHAKAVKGFGQIYTKNASSTVNIAANTYSLVGSISCNSSNDRLINAYVTASANVSVADWYSVTPYSLSLYARNNGSTTINGVQGHIICWNPNGSTW